MKEMQNMMKEELLKKIEDRTLVAGVVGLGYVGLPLAVEKAKAGYTTIGLDVQKAKVDMVNEGHNYIGDVVDSDLEKLVKEGKLRATSDFSFIKDVDFIAICVPTPLDSHQEPDISYVRDSTIAISKYLRKGTMVVLESTTYPGTTEELIRPLLEEGSGLKCGEDFYLGFSPERVDPGNLIYTPEGKIGVIDFNRWEVGDPYEEFYKLESFGRELSVPYCIGQIDSYFQDHVPVDFWKALAVYVAHASLYSIKWAEKFGQEEIDGMIRRCRIAFDDYDGFSSVVPRWYHKWQK